MELKEMLSRFPERYMIKEVIKMKTSVVDPMRKRRCIDILLDSFDPFYDKNSIEYKIMGSMLKRKKKKKGKTI